MMSGGISGGFDVGSIVGIFKTLGPAALDLAGSTAPMWMPALCAACAAIPGVGRASVPRLQRRIGRGPAATPQVYFIAEVSGLPPANSGSFAKLRSAREALKSHFGAALPGSGYSFYLPPIPVSMEGSLFFDLSQYSGAAEPAGEDTGHLGGASSDKDCLRALGEGKHNMGIRSLAVAAR